MTILDLNFIGTAMSAVSGKVEQIGQDDSGATAIEYALIAGATGLALVAALPALETAVGDTYGLFATWLTT